jgi:hypothetical protein
MGFNRRKMEDQRRQLGDVCRDPLRIIALAAIAGKN